MKAITRTRKRSCITVLPVRETKMTVNPDMRMYNPELTNPILGENLRVNLSKLRLPVFDGNLQHWQEFWDVYKATIHDQQTLSAVSKFSYLKSVLKGSAL